MILITGIQYTEVKGDSSYIEEFRNKVVGETDKIKDAQPANLEGLSKVICEGREFSSTLGEEIVIGMTPDVSKLLGSPLEALKKTEANSEFDRKQLVIMSREAVKYRDKANKNHLSMVAARKQRDSLMGFRESMENLSFWGRLKFLFSGKLIKLEV